MKNIGIIGTGSCTPKHHMTNDDFKQYVDTSDDWIYSRTGIKSRYISTGETTTDLAIGAAEEAIKSCGVEPLDIDLIIVATLTPDQFMPSTACKVQKAIGASNAMAFDLSAACSGFVFALNTAVAYMQMMPFKKALVIGAEVMSKVLNWEDRATLVLFGDGAGGVILSQQEEVGLKSFYCKSIGSKGEYLESDALPLQGPFASTVANPYVRMNGKEVFKFASNMVPLSISNVLEEADTTPESVDWYVLHQANSRMLEVIAKRFQVPLDKFYMNIDRLGNTSAASIPIALDEMAKGGYFKEEKQVVLAGFGAGLTYGAVYMRIKI